MAQVSDSYFEPATEDSVRWTLRFMGQRVGPDHIYGNFTRGVTFDETPEYVEFWITDIEIIEGEEYKVHYLQMNCSAAPYEFSFSTLDWSVGEHDVEVMVSYPGLPGTSGGGRTYVFEHQDRSGDQLWYTGATIGIYTLAISGAVGIIFGSFKLYKRRSKTRSSRFE
jgi:hypothetical protein